MRPHREIIKRWWIIGGLWGLYFCFGLGFTGIPPLVQPIQAALDMSSMQMGHILGSYPWVISLGHGSSSTCSVRFPARILLFGRGRFRL